MSEGWILLGAGSVIALFFGWLVLELNNSQRAAGRATAALQEAREREQKALQGYQQALAQQTERFDKERQALYEDSQRFMAANVSTGYEKDPAGDYYVLSVRFENPPFGGLHGERDRDYVAEVVASQVRKEIRTLKFIEKAHASRRSVFGRFEGPASRPKR